MNVTLGLLGHTGDGGGGGGDGVPSDGSTTAKSILTRSKGNNTTVMSTSEVNSSYPDENSDGLELGLGLSIGGCGGLKSKGVVVANGGWGQYARILTAKDFQISKPKPNSSSSSSSVNIPNSSTSGTKRTATDSVSPPNGTSVVGWPPVSKARIPSLANQIKSPTVNLMTTTEQNKSNNRTIGMKNYSNERKVISNTKYRSVKVNMDGSPIGRKVDLNAHTSYEMLALTLEEMFLGRRLVTDAARPSRLLDATSEFVLTYEDKDGDCMLVGDVPWQMFLSSVKRLRIMINSESNELSSEFSAKQHE
ncbi:auxin-responsive protein IAA12-like [Rutidosis leptorrhynchoides]|uniref:auxin-responsive protein IAA12-like n=1 Tax=Rutidosis leptorrhynchoides TaxID=125765 RepID=UPI003A99A2B7